MSLPSDASFELGIGWTYGGNAARSTAEAYHGLYSGLCLSQKSLLGSGDGGSTITSEQFATISGVEHVLQFRYHNDGVQYEPLLVYLDFAGGGYNLVDTIQPNDGTGGWNLHSLTFTPTASTVSLRFQTQINTGPSVFVDRWYLDVIDTYPGDSVAIKLSERAVDAVVSTFQTNFGTELAAIDTDRADSITLAVPANGDYYKRPKVPIAGGEAHVEVFEEAIELEHRYSDTDAQRATYEVPLIVRVTVFNRNGETAEVMRTRLRRYTAAVYNTFIRNSRLGGADDAIQIAAVDRIDWDIDESEDGESVTKVRVTASATVRCEEVYA